MQGFVCDRPRRYGWSWSRRRCGAALALVLAMQTSVSAQPAGERWKPQVQIAAFKTFMTRYVKQTLGSAVSEADLQPDAFEILAMDDLNEDSNLDFVTFQNSIGFCGSGGCFMTVFLSTGGGGYKAVLDLLGHSTPRIRRTKTNGLKDIFAYYYLVNHLPVWSVYRWDGKKYDLAHYQFCGGLHLEYCDASAALIIEPLSNAPLEVKEKARMYASPDTSAEEIDGSNAFNSIVGKVRGKEWYLIQLWKGTAAFVPAVHVARSRPR